jgi:hypothetical protein
MWSSARDRPVRAHGHEARGHQPPDRLFGIAEQLQRLLQVLRSKQFQDALELVGRQAFEKGRSIVRHQFVQDAPGLLQRQPVDDLALQAVRHVREGIRAAFGGQCPQHRESVAAVHLGERVRDVLDRQRLEPSSQAILVAGLQPLEQ